ncbi:MAG TPA: SUMF1/EgtB/PvdO family nonheme iron enzyme [Verrucomicrobiae bacterium]|nr:SUMF1/EgtB/PvdO family nonheme iron enzyme [Verrucomicrobiae bacterium]
MNPTQRLSALLLAGALAPWTGFAQTNLTPPQVQNVRVAQRSGAIFVDITYDLVDPDSTNIYMIAEFSSDGGTTYGLPIYSLSGDIGPVRPGPGRHIVWNAWNDWAGNYTTNGRIRLTADDSNSALPPSPTNPPAPNLVWIPSGTFDMLRIGRYVYLSRGFWISRFETTQGEYVALMTNNPSHHTGTTNLPVENVTWDEALEYCQRLTTRERAAGRINNNLVYRLPTEAEWEYACRAGTTNQFPYGDDPNYVRLQAYAWYTANSGGHTQPVGAKIPNRWGLFDMMGNVWEYCSDYWDSSLPAGNYTDPQGPESGNYRIVRGDSYGSDATSFALRRYCDPGCGGLGYYSVGFRVVLAPTP